MISGRFHKVQRLPAIQALLLILVQAGCGDTSPDLGVTDEKPPVGNLRVTTSTQGTPVLGTQHLLTVDGSTIRELEPNDSVSFFLAVGPHWIGLQPADPACTVGKKTRSIAISAAHSTVEAFAVDCTRATLPATLTIIYGDECTASLSIRVDGTLSFVLPFMGDTVLSLAPGDHLIESGYLAEAYYFSKHMLLVWGTATGLSVCGPGRCDNR